MTEMVLPHQINGLLTRQRLYRRDAKAFEKLVYLPLFRAIGATDQQFYYCDRTDIERSLMRPRRQSVCGVGDAASEINNNVGIHQSIQRICLLRLRSFAA